MAFCDVEQGCQPAGQPAHWPGQCLGDGPGTRIAEGKLPSAHDTLVEAAWREPKAIAGGREAGQSLGRTQQIGRKGHIGGRQVRPVVGDGEDRRLIPQLSYLIAGGVVHIVGRASALHGLGRLAEGQEQALALSRLLQRATQRLLSPFAPGDVNRDCQHPVRFALNGQGHLDGLEPTARRVHGAWGRIRDESGHSAVDDLPVHPQELLKHFAGEHAVVPFIRADQFL